MINKYAKIHLFMVSVHSTLFVLVIILGLTLWSVIQLLFLIYYLFAAVKYQTHAEKVRLDKMKIFIYDDGEFTVYDPATKTRTTPVIDVNKIKVGNKK